MFQRCHGCGMRTFASKNYKMVQVNNKMTTRDFIAKVAKIFNVRKRIDLCNIRL